MSNYLSAKCDYYRATTDDALTIGNIAKGYYSVEATEQTIPLYGYRNAIKNNRSDGVFLFSPHTATMGNCSQFGGTAITKLMEETNRASVDALRGVHTGRWKVTRLDIAIDCYDAEFRPREIIRRVEEKTAKTVWRTWREVRHSNPDEGHTVYGGGLESEKRIRIYDKAAESGTEGVWTRYEMVFSGKRAQEAWNKVADCRTDKELLPVALEMLASLLDFPEWTAWQEAFGIESKHEWVEVPRVESDTWRWLKSQVAPSFRDAFDKDGNWSLLEKFVELVKNG